MMLAESAKLQPGGFLGCLAKMLTVIRHRLEALEFKDCEAAAWRFPGLLGQNVNGNKALAGSLRFQGLRSCSLEVSWAAGPEC